YRIADDHRTVERCGHSVRKGVARYLRELGCSTGRCPTVRIAARIADAQRRRILRETSLGIEERDFSIARYARCSKWQIAWQIGNDVDAAACRPAKDLRAKISDDDTRIGGHSGCEQPVVIDHWPQSVDLARVIENCLVMAVLRLEQRGASIRRERVNLKGMP